MELLDIITIILLIAILIYLIDFTYKCTVEGFKFTNSKKPTEIEMTEQEEMDEHTH